MGDRTGISWTEATWNPIRGCTEVSAGCDHCYAATVAARFNGPGQPYAGLAYKDEGGRARWTGAIMHVEKALDQPLRWQRPRMIFVNSMSDLFHPGVGLDFTDRIFATMALAGRHTFQVLTKRPQRMANYLRAPNTIARIDARAIRLWDERRIPGPYPGFDWPLPNLWVGTSVEDARALSRLPALGRCPAKVRFLSCEPLIGPLGDGLGGALIEHRVGWVIAGGESGPGFRPMDPAWARQIRDACAAAGVPFFFKQSSGPRSGTGATLDGIEYQAFPVTL